MDGPSREWRLLSAVLLVSCTFMGRDDTAISGTVQGRLSPSRGTITTCLCLVVRRTNAESFQIVDQPVTFHREKPATLPFSMSDHLLMPALLLDAPTAFEEPIEPFHGSIGGARRRLAASASITVDHPWGRPHCFLQFHCNRRRSAIPERGH